MREGRSKKWWGAYFFGFLTLLLAVCIPVGAGVVEGDGEYEIYPTPQSITYEAGSTTLSDSVNVVCGDAIDQYTKDRITATLDVLGLEQKEGATVGSGTNLVVDVYDSEDISAAYKQQIGAEVFFEGTVEDIESKNRYDKYTLQISNGTITILGEDVDAAYDGVTTLKRIFEQLKGKTVRNLTVKDYAEIEFRGFIEGYYGNPWSHEDRIDLMQFGGEIKMNQYIYAPKDDPMHNSKWRQLYDEEGLLKIKELAAAGNENKCFFVYALHTFMNNAVNLSDATYESEVAVVKAKFEQVIREADVRQIAILEDDANGETAEHIVRYLNDMNNWLKELKQEIPDLKTDILYCPTCYGATTNPKLTTISNGVSDEIHIVMTGGKVWGEVSEEFAIGFYNGLGGEASETSRYPYMWVNWPCNDNTKDSQIMGGHNYILHTGIIGSHYEGIVLNPIQESEPSKVGIFTAADYSWNIWQDPAEGDQAWEDSFKYIDHMTPIESEESNALREVARHMIRQGPEQLPGKQVEFDESLNIKDLIIEVSDSLDTKAFDVAKIEELREEFVKMNEAAKLYLDPERSTNKRMVKQMTPFLSCFRDMTEADIYLLSALKGIAENSSDDIWENYAEAQALYERSKTYDFLYYNRDNPPSYQMTLYAKAGRKYITPFTDKILKYISSEVKILVDPERVTLEKDVIYKVGGKTSGVAEEGTAKNAVDGNPSTTYLLKADQQIGDYIGVSFNLPVSVKSIQMSLSVNGHENDYIAEGTMEYTEDGKIWQAFPDEVQPAGQPEVDMDLPQTMQLRGFRWVCKGLGGRNRWIGIKDIGYNHNEDLNPQEPDAERYEATFSCTSYWSLAGGSVANMTDGDDASAGYWDPSENTTEGIKDHSQVGEYIQIDLGTVKEVGIVRAVVGNSAKAGDKWTNYHLEYSETGAAGSWTALGSYEDTERGLYAYEVDLQGASARYLKLVNDVKVNKWIYFGGFEAYPVVEVIPGQEGKAMDYTNTNDKNWRVEYGEDSSKVFPRENATLQPGEYIGLKLSRIRAVTEITVDGQGIDSLTLDKSMNGTEWQNAAQESPARYIRLKNDTAAPVTFSLTSFMVESDEIKPMDLLDTTLGIGQSNKDARSLKTTGAWFDGNLTTSALYTSVPVAGSYITYDLGQEIELRSLKVFVDNNMYDYPRDAKIQASLTNEAGSWTDLITIGDGVQNTQEDRDKIPTESGAGWQQGDGAVEVIYAVVKNEAIPNVKARYLRLYFTAGNSGCMVKLNEIRINDGQYYPSVNDPSFETNAVRQQGYDLENLTDRDLTTAFRPSGKGDGYLIYHFSDTTNLGGFNILQSGISISNAKVSVRTGSEEWQKLGTLDRSYSTFYTANLENVYAVKLEWTDKEPVIYEIIPLEKEDNVLKKYNGEESKAQAALDVAKEEVETANSAVSAIDGQIQSTISQMNTAANEVDKLRAEVELQRLYAAKAAAEAILAEKKAIEAQKKADYCEVVASNKQLMAAGTSDPEQKKQYEDEAEQNAQEAVRQEQEAKDQEQIANDKNSAIAGFEAAEQQKKTELARKEEELKNPPPSPVTNFKSGDMNYSVIDAAAQTVAVTGPVNKAKVKNLTIRDTVNYDGKDWTVIEVAAGAFKGCSKLKSVKLGSKLEKIGSQAFAQCKNLKKVDMKKTTKLTSVAKGAFKKSTKAEIKVPKSKFKKYQRMLKKAGVSVKKIKK